MWTKCLTDILDRTKYPLCISSTQYLFNNLNAGSKEENKTVFTFLETEMLKRLTINMSKRFYNSDNNSAMRKRVVGGLDSIVKLANLDSIMRKGLSGSEDRKEDHERVLRQD